MVLDEGRLWPILVHLPVILGYYGYRDDSLNSLRVYGGYFEPT